MRAPDDIRRIAVIGAGTIGASWTSYFLAQGREVVVSDPAPGAAAAVAAFVDAAWPVLERIGLAADADPSRWRIESDPAAAAADADFIQENAPEDAALKIALYDVLERTAAPDVLISSSTSGLLMSDLQRGRRYPERFVVSHPFNPPHLVPLVEVVGGAATSAAAVEATLAIWRALGKHPIHVRREVPGHIANRLQAALWREAVSLVAEGVASVADVDAAVAHGPGLRWALMGPHMIFHLGGGAGGMEAFLRHFGPSIERWWDDLGQPRLTPEVARRLIEGVAEEAGGRSSAALAARRDRRLAELLAALHSNDKTA